MPRTARARRVRPALLHAQPGALDRRGGPAAGPRLNRDVASGPAPPDGFHLDAALGWLALQLPGDALDDLDRIQPEHRQHAAVLAVRFAALVHSRRHAEAHAVADEHSRLHPADSQGWVNLANAHFWLDDAAAARACAAARVDAFPEDWALPYNLACYAVKLGQPDEARRWFAEALRRGPQADVLATGLADPDLAPLHAELRVRLAALPAAK